MLFEKIQLEPDEEILTMVRKHWFVIIAELFGTFIIILLPFVALFLLVLFPNATSPLGLDPSSYTKVLAFGVAAWLLLAILSAFRIWTHYYLDLWVVTDRRIIVIDQLHFFNRNVSIFRLERLQDIEFTISGLIPTLLNFGTISAQTAGHSEDNFHSSSLPDPRGLQALIQKATDARISSMHTHN